MSLTDTSKYFSFTKPPASGTFSSRKNSSSSLAPSTASSRSTQYGKSPFFEARPNPHRQKLSKTDSSDRTLAGNKDCWPSPSSSSVTSVASSSSSFSDFQQIKRKGQKVAGSTIGSTPNRSRRLGHDTSILGNSSFFGDVNPGMIVAIVEGRGSARGEVGIASLSLHNPTLVLCQVSDSRTYVRTLTKIAIFNPAEIIVPNGITSMSNDPSQSKLYEDIKDRFPRSSITQVHRKYFSDSRGLQMIKHLVVPEYASVELQLRHKYYALSAASCLLKYVEFVENTLYAPKV